MEVLFVSHKHPPSIGGMEKQSYELVNRMKNYATVHTVVFEETESRVGFFLKVKKRITEILYRNPKVKIIHYNDGLMAAWCLKYGNFGSVKQIVTLHGLDLVFPNPIYQNYILPQFNKLDLIIAVSRATAQAAIARGLTPSKIFTIPNGVDIDESEDDGCDLSDIFGKDLSSTLKHKKLLVAYGRPVKRKGFTWFVKEVMPLLGDETLLVFAGPLNKKEPLSVKAIRALPPSLSRQIELFLGLPSDENELRSIVSSSNSHSQVIHVGKLPFLHLKKLLKSSTAFIMPNIYISGDMEGFGLVCLEACISDTTVFAANIQGIPEAIHHGKNGYLIPSGDAEAWAACLKEFFKTGKVGELQLEDAKAYTQAHFSWNRMVLQYYQAFEKVLDN